MRAGQPGVIRDLRVYEGSECESLVLRLPPVGAVDSFDFSATRADHRAESVVWARGESRTWGARGAVRLLGKAADRFLLRFRGPGQETGGCVQTGSPGVQTGSPGVAQGRG